MEYALNFKFFKEVFELQEYEVNQYFESKLNSHFI